MWLTQEHLARLYNTSKQNVSQHLKSIFESGELDAATKVKKFFTMGKKEGQVAERPIYHYGWNVRELQRQIRMFAYDRVIAHQVETPSAISSELTAAQLPYMPTREELIFEIERSCGRIRMKQAKKGRL